MASRLDMEKQIRAVETPYIYSSISIHNLTGEDCIPVAIIFSS